MNRVGRGLALGVLLAGGLSRSAQAEPLRLELEAPAGCTTRERIVREVERRIHSGGREIDARAVIRESAGAFELEVAFDEGRRSLRGDSCAALAETLTVILALAIDPGANVTPEVSPVEATGADVEGPAGSPGTPETGAARGPERRGKATPAPVTAVPPKPADRGESRAARADSRLRFGASALLFGETGALPGPTFGPGARARLESGGWAAEVSGGYLLPRFAQLPEGPEGKGGELSLWMLQAAACRALGKSVDLCAGAEAGQIAGAGRDVETERTGRALWAAALIQLGIGTQLGAGTYGDARLALAAPFVRPSFGIDGYEWRYRPGAVSGRILLGFGFR